MNILIIPSWYPETPNELYGSFFREQAHAIKTRGHNVYVLNGTYTSLKNIFRGRCRYSLIDDNGMPVYQKLIPSLGFSRNEKLFVALFERRIKKLYKKWAEDNKGVHIDVIHAHACYPAGFVACKLGKRLGIPVVVTEHRSSYMNGKLSESQKRIIQYCREESSKLICVGHGLRNVIERNSTGEKDDVIVIPNMCTDSFACADRQDHDDFVFVSVGGLIPRKRHAQLIKCFLSEFSNTNGVKLKIIGKGPEKAFLEKMIADENATDKVFLLGALSRENVAKELSMSDSFVLSSASETFGVVYIEALFLGLPIIGTRNGGADDIIERSNGILIDVDNDEQLCNAMSEMVKNYESYDHKMIKKNAVNQFSENAVIDRLMAVYQAAVL